MTSITYGQYSLTIYSKITDPNSAIVIYVHGAERAKDLIPSLVAGENFALVFVDGLNWNDDTTPWPAPGVFKDSGDFGGKADTYLELLTSKLVPFAEEKLGLISPVRGIAGYSLGGLLAIYSMYKTDVFARFASMSGSLWYDGFLDFAKSNVPKVSPEHIYLSLGSREKKSKNKRMAAISSITEEFRVIFEKRTPHVIYEVNPGNHFTDVEKRIAAGISWIIKGTGHHAEI